MLSAKRRDRAIGQDTFGKTRQQTFKAPFLEDVLKVLLLIAKI